MCELLCVSSLLPTTVSITLERLARHGALGQANVDGWGLAAYDERDIRLYKEPEPAGQSAWLAFILGSGLECSLTMSHIRRATQGPLTHANTQPYARELDGRMHVFAHNGDLKGLGRLDRVGAGRRFTPMGQTDSELAFCILLQRMEGLWTRAQIPTLKARLQVVETFAADIRLLGTANFLYADGDLIFAHAHRRPPYVDGRGQPGLWRLEQHSALDHATLAEHGVQIGDRKGQEINLVASVPLTDDAWVPFDAGEIVVLRQGRLARDVKMADIPARRLS